MSSHHIRFSSLKAQNVSEGGYRIRATKDQFPILRGMSMYKLVLHPQSAREPHWHPNADELGVCLKGRVLVSFYGNKNAKRTFLISEGEVFLIPSGALHAIENVGKENAELVLQFSHEEPEDFDLSAVFGMFSDAVLGNTWGLDAQRFHSLKRQADRSAFAKKLASSSPIQQDAHYVSEYQYALEASAPLIHNKGGSARVARQNVWPVLQRQAVYSLRMNGTGMREPHWHPETAELGYVKSGKGRMSILSPTGKIDTYEMQEGDLYFIPKAYPHHIENLEGHSELHVLIFFDQPMPQDIGFTGSVKSNSDEVLESILFSPEHVMRQIPVYYEDLFIVNKVNRISD